MNIKTKIIITGGTGYIGSHTAVALLESGYEVVLIDNLCNSSIETVGNIYTITGLRPKMEIVDLCNKKECDEVFNKHSDAIGIIHFAALKAVGESVQKPLRYYQNNLTALMNTLDSAVQNKINNFIFTSSDTVYGQPEKVPISEQEKTKRPFSLYGNSKKIGEEIMEDLTLANKELAIISIRYFNPIGAHKSEFLGELPTGTPNNLMPYITQTAIGLRDKLFVFGNDYPTKDGTPIRDYVHVLDLADAHLKALERILNRQNKSPMEVFNSGSGKGYSVLDVIYAFERVSGQKLPELISSADLANEKLGWKATRGLEEMVASAWEWEKKIR